MHIFRNSSSINCNFTTIWLDDVFFLKVEFWNGKNNSIPCLNDLKLLLTEKKIKQNNLEKLGIFTTKYEYNKN